MPEADAVMDQSGQEQGKEDAAEEKLLKETSRLLDSLYPMGSKEEAVVHAIMAHHLKDGDGVELLTWSGKV